MVEFCHSAQAEAIAAFHMPRYDELPTLHLYLDQVLETLVQIFTPLFGDNSHEKWITPSMVGNYAKQGIMPRPIGKRYGREHMAHLIYICLAKHVLTVNDARVFMGLLSTTTLEHAYNVLCEEMEYALHETFHLEPLPQPELNPNNLEAARALHAFVFSLAHKLYIAHYLRYLSTEGASDTQ